MQTESVQILKPNRFFARYTKSLRFGRALSKSEQSDLGTTMKTALQKLGKDQFVMILHGPSFPASSSKNDTGIGSVNISGAKRLFADLKTFGITGIQLGPAGRTNRRDASPYGSTLFSLNPLSIDLAPLTTQDWGRILDPKIYSSIKKKNPNAGQNRVAYEYAYDEYLAALESAFFKFTEKARTNYKTVAKLVKRFEAFKVKNQAWLNNDALYEGLRKYYSRQEMQAVYNRLASGKPKTIHSVMDKTQPDFEKNVASLQEIYENVKALGGVHVFLERTYSDKNERAVQRFKIEKLYYAVKHTAGWQQDAAVKAQFMALFNNPTLGEGAWQTLIHPSKEIINTNYLYSEIENFYEHLSEYTHWHGPNATRYRNLNQADLATHHAVDIDALKQIPNMDTCIELYKFCQFIAAEQLQQTKKAAAKQQLKLFADKQIAIMDRDVWTNPGIFMKDYALGCPPDYYDKKGQAWGFPVIDPDTYFTRNGKLGPGGQYLYEVFRKMFRDNPGGVRIDHIIGLVDPWVYPKNGSPLPANGGARLFSSPGHPVLGRYAKVTPAAVNTQGLATDNEEYIAHLSPKQIAHYAEVLEKIVVQAAKAEGLGKNAIIPEDLGTLTHPVRKVLQYLGLDGIRVTQFVTPTDDNHFYRGKNIKPNEWAMIGLHDTESLKGWVDNLFSQPLDARHHHALQLVDDLHHPTTVTDRRVLRAAVMADRTRFMKLKAAELLASPSRKLQILFTDLFGVKGRYNTPGTTGNINWRLRMPTDYMGNYYQQVADGQAVNWPDAMLIALQARGIKDAALVKKLTQFKTILAEKS